MSVAAIPAGEWEGEPPEHWRARWGLPALYVYDRIGSTNDEARRLAEAGAPSGTAVLAEVQTAGRGREGRRWHAPVGAALLLSLLLRLDHPPGGSPSVGTLPLRVGLAVARAIERVAGIHVGIKWPNDIVTPGQRKLAGILCEGAFTPRAGGFVIAGVGLNVGQGTDDFPLELRRTATSLRLITGRAISRAELARVVMIEILAHSGRVGAVLEGAALDELAARDVLRGERIAIDGEPRGTGAGIAADGALRVRAADGREHRIRNGTVRVLRDTTSAPRKIHP